MPRFALCLALLCALVPAARALQLGETREQLIARHGAPAAEDHARNLAMYFWEGWSAQVEFQDKIVRKLTYRRNWYLQEAEIKALLQSNGGSAHWKEVAIANSGNRRWERDDGAAAMCAREKPMSIVFQTGGLTASALLEPTVVFPSGPNANPNPTFSKSPSFPKMLGAVPEPELPVADPPPAPAPDRPLPKLPVADLSADSTSPPVIQSAPATAAPEPKPAPAPQVSQGSPAPSPSSSHGVAYTLGSLAVLGMLAAGAFYFRKSRPSGFPMSAPAMPKSKSLPNAPAPAPASGVEALRLDQFEMLIGEIFRRQGYTVELSAAVNAEDGIDLLLRRDGETIPVQCKHWKMPHVTEGELREFYSAMATSGAPRGIFVTTGSFGVAAQNFAREKGIELLGGTELAQSMSAVAKPGENLAHVPEWLDEFVAHARIFDPECPTCHGTMVIRHNRANGTPTWTCRGYPRCPGRREPRLDLLPNAAAN